MLGREGLVNIQLSEVQSFVTVFCESESLSAKQIDQLQNQISRDNRLKDYNNQICFVGKFSEACHDQYDDEDIAKSKYAVTAWIVNDPADDVAAFIAYSPGKKVFIQEKSNKYQDAVLTELEKIYERK
jgi:hypothetical protein